MTFFPKFETDESLPPGVIAFRHPDGREEWFLYIEDDQD